MVKKKGQFKIQQMIFMVLGVFILFILVGVFFMKMQVGGIRGNYEQLQREQALSSLNIIASMPELSYDSREETALDLDKLLIMSGNFSSDYESFWPVSSVKVYLVYPPFEREIKCPALNCNYYEIYKSEGTGEEVSSFVSLCRRVSVNNRIYDECGIGKLVVGVKA